MKSLAFALLAVIVTLTTLAIAQDMPVVDPTITTMSNDELVAARQAAMKEDGRLLNGASVARGDDAIKSATIMLQNFTNFPALFREGSITYKSHALPIIWEQWDQFEGLLKKGQAAAADMQARAEADDHEGYAGALQTLGGLCKQCHETYRQPGD